MLIKNISENSVLVRVLGIKQVVEAGQVVEVTDEEAKSHLTLYSRIFEKSETMPEVKVVEPEETKFDDTAVASDEVIEEKTEEQKENTKTKKSSKKSETSETPETEEK